jgi:hypothetical protein
LRVSGQAKEKLTLESFSLPRFAESPPIALEARFKNEGTVHEAPQGTIEGRKPRVGLIRAKSPGGQTVTKLDSIQTTMPLG